MSRILLHLSDLHFGRVPAGMADALLFAAERIKPDLVVVSGDLTQRARIEEFEQARDFLQRLPYPRLVIPGNHDVPLFNPYGRFVERLARYRLYIEEDLSPSFVDSELAVYGVNTARSLTWKGGRINSRQIDEVHDQLCNLPESVTRVITTHHPIGVARTALARWSACGADLLLCGHLHVGATELDGRTLVVNAGTAISSRGRGQANSFNVIGIATRRQLTITQWSWDGDSFEKLKDAIYERTADGWTERAPEPV